MQSLNKTDPGQDSLKNAAVRRPKQTRNLELGIMSGTSYVEFYEDHTSRANSKVSREDEHTGCKIICEL